MTGQVTATAMAMEVQHARTEQAIARSMAGTESALKRIAANTSPVSRDSNAPFLADLRLMGANP